MDYRYIAFLAILGWFGGIWVGPRPRYGDIIDGWPDWYCPRCSLVFAAIGGWVTVAFVGPDIAHGTGGTVVTAIAGGALFASLYNIAASVLTRGRAAVRGPAAGQ